MVSLGTAAFANSSPIIYNLSTSLWFSNSGAQLVQPSLPAADFLPGALQTLVNEILIRADSGGAGGHSSTSAKAAEVFVFLGAVGMARVKNVSSKRLVKSTSPIQENSM